MLSIDSIDMISLRPDLSLQPITTLDQERLLELMMKIYRPVYQHLWFDDGSSYLASQFNLQQLQSDLSSPTVFYYFVHLKEELIGILRFLKDCPTSAINESNTTKLHRIYLDPSIHGKGIGKALMRWMFDFLKEQNQESIWLECMDTQLAAYHFYQQLGFKTIEPFTLDSPTMRSEMRGMLRMKLNLNNA